MPQLFSRSADLVFRVALLGIPLGLVSLGAIAAVIVRSDWITEVGLRPHQPVPFSHAHHVGQLGIDCRYCHGSVEVSATAGFPPTHTCMTCHSEIWRTAPMLAPVRESLAEEKPLRWRRVARLPDYVYFRHDIHIAKGVGCVECHGRVDEMPLMMRAKAFTMQFCISCHRDPGPHLRAEKDVFDLASAPAGADAARANELIRRYAIRDSHYLTNCYACHR
jgi:hypothetical protein